MAAKEGGTVSLLGRNKAELDGLAFFLKANRDLVWIINGKSSSEALNMIMNDIIRRIIHYYWTVVNEGMKVNVRYENRTISQKL